jgi:hypothetical protein
MKKITFTFIALSLIMMFSTASHSTTYKVAAYAWEPFISSDRTDGGISIKLLRDLCAKRTNNYDALRHG